ncbi:TetR family transcriptional regulator [Dulcicalothrix desertica PCC 7102]|uniref:TetR family transcriptional regulator n=1 Tax=Dulcicalothrix desertica PCC 7102 TaxID=232991 RepID=A0A3S1AKF9_9CYAN|nr:TetR/AcrR family transcriptional regulator [Dulcicalothrix desertica]RUT02821.1 TetR family transcriptional regulator [Dulcicalothrix desertica PCC 7102]TWH38945.1 TetR family transcriptional regulator [Dulcicalothrix desertica PCC 7102]
MGRPKEFDREEVLQKALYTFWEKGYDATTLPDLLESMGINRSSFYNSFGDKQTLFREVMSLYYQQIGIKRLAILHKAKSIKQGLWDYFNHNIDVAVAEYNPGGCLLTNTATNLKTIDEQVTKHIVQGVDRLEQALFNLLEKGQQSGEIAPNKDIKAIARLMISVSYGLNIAARIHSDREMLLDMVKAALSTLD